MSEGSGCRGGGLRALGEALGVQGFSILFAPSLPSRNEAP